LIIQAASQREVSLKISNLDYQKIIINISIAVKPLAYSVKYSKNTSGAASQSPSISSMLIENRSLKFVVIRNFSVICGITRNMVKVLGVVVYSDCFSLKMG
jgi:hypothetical protein